MIEKINDFEVHNHSEVKLTYMGNVTEKLYLSRRNKEATVQKLSADKILILRTGEVKNINHQNLRVDNKNEIRRTLRRLRAYLNTNVITVSNCRWMTLTYAENMTDPGRLYKDFKNFNKRLRNKYGNYEYIVAMEPQGRGAWHAHVVLIFDHTAPYIPNEVLKDTWGHGFVTVKKLDDIDNVGAYLTAYLGDMELDEYVKSGQGLPEGDILKEVEYADENGEKQSKYYIKGGRLNMYPTGFNLYRCSRGIKKPIEEYCTEDEARKKVSAATLTYSSTNLVTKDNGLNFVIDKKYYNNMRFSVQG